MSAVDQKFSRENEAWPNLGSVLTWDTKAEEEPTRAARMATDFMVTVFWVSK